MTTGKLKIATLHCLGSSPYEHATQKWHFAHRARACAALAECNEPIVNFLMAQQR